MKLKKEFITHTSGDEQLMISAGGSFNGMVRSNKTAAFIIDMLKEETTKENIVSAMLERYDADEAVISADVDKVIDALRGIGAIDE
jgi:methyltransferase-like protein